MIRSGLRGISFDFPSRQAAARPVAPVKPCSSLTLHASTTVTGGGSGDSASREKAESIEAIPPLTSHAPRP